MNRGAMAKAAVLFLLILFVVPSAALSAQGSLPGKIVPCDGTSIGGGKPCTVCHIGELAQNVLNTGIYIAVFLSAILFAWAGWTYMTAMGSTHKVQSAKKAFTNVAIGLVIILIGWLVIDSLMKTLVGNSNSKFGPWYSICGS